MKQKIIFSLMFLFIFLFFVRGGWLPTPVRLDTGDPPGASGSSFPDISSSGSNVYVVWIDNRNGEDDIYFNYSADNGVTWQANDIRLDTGDKPGVNDSWQPQISASGSNVYVVWKDYRNGNSDIYFNYSTDYGTSWQVTDIRLDTGDTPGMNGSHSPQISSSGSYVYVVWFDYRNGASSDVYFNYSANNGVTWQASDVRLDLGDTPGANYSWYPQISASGSNVYVVWHDVREAEFTYHIYFNYSIDNGASWQASDIRLDDTPYPNSSWYPQVSSNGNNVYVVWYDYRNGHSDIYLDYSTNSGATWQASDVRLDLGDTPGANYSWYPQISASGSNVYVVWQDDRHGARDIYFNSSIDGGASWQVTDIRLDTGDVPGANSSRHSNISTTSSNVYVVWADERNGWPDIYFNFSIDSGITWQASDIRLDTGDSPGFSASDQPQIACFEDNAYVVWEDGRNGGYDIYFNTNSAVDPLPDIKANGSDGPITIIRSDVLDITVEFDAGSYSGVDADWWLVARTPLGWYYYQANPGWLPGREVTLQIPLRDLPSREVLNMSGLPIGSYVFYFGVDMDMNGVIDENQAYYDKVKVTIDP